ncbi:MAG: Imm30 family immunity protein [Acutalibacteraceae bacterium]|nr:Imm30 family immunity protein [Acutalibacteraceae bacterium]
MEKFEDISSDLFEVMHEEDIVDLCRVFDDNTDNHEMMFGLVHLIEAFSSDKAFEFTVLGVANMTVTAPEWAKIIMYRCLNHLPSRKMLKKAISVSNIKTQKTIISLLNTIKSDDADRFGIAVDEVIDKLH